jgi:hypothetical protein
MDRCAQMRGCRLPTYSPLSDAPARLTPATGLSDGKQLANRIPPTSRNSRRRVGRRFFDMRGTDTYSSPATIVLDAPNGILTQSVHKFTRQVCCNGGIHVALAGAFGLAATDAATEVRLFDALSAAMAEPVRREPRRKRTNQEP